MTSADWVCFIGDDDFVDPSVGSLLARLRKHDETFDYMTWSHMRYQWPGWSDSNVTVEIKLSTQLKPYPLDKGFASITECAGKRPLALASLYHGALHRNVIDKVRSAHTDDGIFFKHSNVDYFGGWVAGLHTQKAAYCNRPLSVAGACGKSNSAAVRTPGAMLRASRTAIAEAKADVVASIPDRTLSREVRSLTEFFHFISLDFFEFTDNKYSFVENWQEALVQRAYRELSERSTLESYEDLRDDLAQFFEEEKIEVPFEPSFGGTVDQTKLARGLHGDGLMVMNDAFPTESAAEFYRFVNQLLLRVDHVGNEVKYIKRGK